MTVIPRPGTVHAALPQAFEALVAINDDSMQSVFEEALSEHSAAVENASGGIRGATEALVGGNVGRPMLIVADISDSQDPLIDIDALADVCEPGTSVIVVGRQNDVNLFRTLVGMGVSDYLVKPFNADQARAAITAALRPPAGSHEKDLAKPGKLVVFIGSHGGVGSSTIALNTGWLLAQRSDHRVAFFDLDLYFGTSTFAFDLEPGRGLRDALEHPDRVDSMFISSVGVPAHERFHIFGSEEPLDGGLEIDPGALDLLVSELREEFRTVVIDLPRHLAVYMRDLLAGADMVCVVADMTMVAMRDTLRLLTLLKTAAPNAAVKVVANRVGGGRRSDSIKVSDFEKGVEHKLDLIIPEDMKHATTAANSGRLLAQVAKSSKTVAAFGELAELIAGDSKKKKARLSLSSLLRKTG